MIVFNSHTTVDVLWQDGTRQHGVPSTLVNPCEFINEHEFFPRQYVVDDALTDTVDVTRDDVDTATGSTSRVGIARCQHSKDNTVLVSWLKSTPPDESGLLEVECDDTASVYDVYTDPDHYVFYGDIVVHLLPNVNGSTPAVQAKTSHADLSWVGRVVDLHEGHFQVKWGDGCTSAVYACMHGHASHFETSNPNMHWLY